MKGCSLIVRPRGYLARLKVSSPELWMGNKPLRCPRPVGSRTLGQLVVRPECSCEKESYHYLGSHLAGLLIPLES